MKSAKKLWDSIMGTPLGIGNGLGSLVAASGALNKVNKPSAEQLKLQEELNAKLMAELDRLNAQQIPGVAYGLPARTVAFVSGSAFASSGNSGYYDPYDGRVGVGNPSKMTGVKAEKPEEPLPPDLSERPISFED